MRHRLSSARPLGRDRLGLRLPAWALCALMLLSGCHSTGWLRTNRAPLSPLTDSLKLGSFTGPEPTPRTMQWLRRHDLVEEFESKADEELINLVSQVAARRQTEENVYALSELAFLAGKRAEDREDHGTAFDMYGISVANAYLYLVDEAFDHRRNPYDPQFRQACDLYNGALESAMRLAQGDGPLVPGTHRSIETKTQSIRLSIVSKGSWRPEQIERLEFASDYSPKGLTNHVRRFGLGVPLIAVFRGDSSRPEDEFHAPGMSIAATALLRVVPEQMQAARGKSTHICVLELHDPLVANDVQIDDGRWIPLETDLSTPLAYSLNHPMFQSTEIGTRGLINPRDSQAVQGIYMLEPYDPRKVPVLMVHGLWSSLNTWMEMFNDLRGDSEIRDHYQFWFYLYPTGQPFWTTAAQLRQDLNHARNVLDPQRRGLALDQMVLVGHSMGGLIAKLQTLDSGDDFWRLISSKPLEDLDVDNDLRRQLAQTWYFRPNDSIRRVVTIASPHRGSDFSNSTTQWLARRLIRLPEALAENTQRLFLDNEDLRHSRLLQINNSVESLSPESPVFEAMLEARSSPDVKYHNVIGVLSAKDVLGKLTPPGDGVVRYQSAHLDRVESEDVVDEDHVHVHRHPRAVLAVQRILYEHLAQLRAEYQRAQLTVRRPGDAPSVVK